MATDTAPATATVADASDVRTLHDALIDACTALRDVAASPTVGNLDAASLCMQALRDWPNVRDSATLHASKGEPRTLSALGWYRCLAKVEASSSAIIRYNARKAS